MAAKLDLAPLPPFDPLHEPSSLSQRWKSWTKRFKTYVAAMNITDDKQKRALLLYQAGPETQEIFETLTDTGDDYKTAQEKLDAYFSPKKNVNYEIFQFRQAVQQPGETVDQFTTRLRKIAINCEFHDTSKEIKAVIIQNCQSKRLRRYALREDALTLDDLLAKARSLEASEMQATGMEKSLPHTSEEVNRVQNKTTEITGSKTTTNTFKHMSSMWTCMAAQDKSMSGQRQNLSEMWKAKPLRKDVSHQVHFQTTPPATAQPKSKRQPSLSCTRRVGK